VRFRARLSTADSACARPPRSASQSAAPASPIVGSFVESARVVASRQRRLVPGCPLSLCTHVWLRFLDVSACDCGGPMLALDSVAGPATGMGLRLHRLLFRRYKTLAFVATAWGASCAPARRMPCASPGLPTTRWSVRKCLRPCASQRRTFISQTESRHGRSSGPLCLAHDAAAARCVPFLACRWVSHGQQMWLLKMSCSALSIKRRSAPTRSPQKHVSVCMRHPTEMQPVASSLRVTASLITGCRRHRPPRPLHLLLPHPQPPPPLRLPHPPHLCHHHRCRPRTSCSPHAGAWPAGSAGTL